MSAWPEIQLKSVASKITKGTTPTTLGFDFTPDGINFIKAESITRGGDIVESTFAKISEKTHEFLKRSQIKKGDILVTIAGIYLGKIGIVRTQHVPANTNQAVAIVRLDNSKAQPEFMKYFLRAPSTTTYLNILCPQSAQPNLNLTQLGNVKFKLPEVAIQKKIAAVLSAYDELIENNQRRIALLEKMAEEVYREWFVRLRFPGHEKVKTIKGVPTGWQIKTLGAVLELCYGKALKDGDRVPGEFHVYGSSGVVGTHNEALVKTPSLVVGRKGNVGSVYWPDRGFFPIDTVYFVKSELPNSFLYFLLRSMNFLNNDAAVPGLNRNQAYSNLFFLPPASLMKKYADVADANFEMKRLIERQNEKLMTIRDSFLPRLISGKLSVENLDIQFPPTMKETA
jgi:type I restriction enzyme, S subunit